MTASTDAPAMPTVVHVVKGRAVSDATESFPGFAAPAVDLDDLVWLRNEPGPAFDAPIAEIIDFLEALGKALELDSNALLQEALDQTATCSTLDRRILENLYRGIPLFFQRPVLEFQVEQELGVDPIDRWASVQHPHGREARVRAFPPRLAHVLAGNTPAVAVTTIVRGALSKGVHLLKLPANDLFTSGAILRTMIELDPDHPTTRSFSAVYWRGGDTTVESAIMRAQYFDKLVVWGGDVAVRNALHYAAPGFEIVSFDPKVSASMVGREAHASEASVLDAADRAANDATLFNQDACAASRYVYVEGTLGEVDTFCAALADAVRKERVTAAAVTRPLPHEIRDEIDVLATLEPLYRVWGDTSGAGLVIRSEDPVDFYPMSKTVNVVHVSDLKDAVRFTNVATQTVGVYPRTRVAELRDDLACQGVQRITALGEVATHVDGLPHDGFYPLRRMMRWVLDDAAQTA